MCVCVVFILASQRQQYLTLLLLFLKYILLISGLQTSFQPQNRTMKERKLPLILRSLAVSLAPSGTLVVFHTSPSLVQFGLNLHPCVKDPVSELLRTAAGLFFQRATPDSRLYCSLLGLCVERGRGVGYKWSILSPFCGGHEVRSAPVTPSFFFSRFPPICFFSSHGMWPLSRYRLGTKADCLILWSDCLCVCVRVE